MADAEGRAVEVDDDIVGAVATGTAAPVLSAKDEVEVVGAAEVVRLVEVAAVAEYDGAPLKRLARPAPRVPPPPAAAELYTCKLFVIAA